MVDKNLNYGRTHIKTYLEKAQPYKTVLDLGAGKGDDLLIAKTICQETQLYALESYEPYVDILEQRGIKVFNFDLERDVFPFEPESIDVIIINQVLEHTKDVFWILHEVSRVLRTGGYFIVGIPNLASLHNRVLLTLGEQPTSIKNDSAHVRGYTKKDFLKLVNCGFNDGYELTAFKGSNFYPFPPLIAKPLSNIFPTMSWGIFFSLRKTKKYNNDGYLKYPIDNKLETKFYLGI